MQLVSRPNPYATASSFSAPAWLPGGNAQTIYAFLLRRTPVAFRRERIATPDGDFIDFDWLDGDAAKPTLVLFHGLEGSSHSHYALACAHVARARGWTLVVPHFRGCSGEINATVRAYHSGDAESIEWMLAQIHSKSPLNAQICAAGISLGGNALTKFCGTHLPAAQNLLQAAASVCAPLDLGISAERIAQGFNKIYSAHFLKTMKHDAAIKAKRFPGKFDALRAARAVTLAEFDDAYTAQVHGYSSGAHYYRNASSRYDIVNIELPFLLIQAANDPFVPDYLMPKAHEVSRFVTRDFPATGGHLGFVSGAFPGHLNWLPQRLFNFFTESLRENLRT